METRAHKHQSQLLANENIIMACHLNVSAMARIFAMPRCMCNNVPGHIRKDFPTTILISPFASKALDDGSSFYRQKQEYYSGVPEYRIIF